MEKDCAIAYMYILPGENYRTLCHHLSSNPGQFNSERDLSLYERKKLGPPWGNLKMCLPYT